MVIIGVNQGYITIRRNSILDRHRLDDRCWIGSVCRTVAKRAIAVFDDLDWDEGLGKRQLGPKAGIATLEKTRQVCILNVAPSDNPAIYGVGGRPTHA